MNQVLVDFRDELKKLENLIKWNREEVCDENYYLLEDKFDQIIDYSFSSADDSLIKNYRRRMVAIKNNLEIYDEEEELISMYSYEVYG